MDDTLFSARIANEVAYHVVYDPTYNQVSSFTDPLSHTTFIGRDSLGNLASITDALGHQVTIFNNNQGLPTSVTDALGHARQISYVQADISSVTDALNRSVSVFTDSVGRVASIADPLGNTTQPGYDVLDRITGMVDAQGGSTAASYDEYANVLTVKDARNVGTHTFTYDSRNRPATYQDPTGVFERYTQYDGMGNLLAKTDRKGQVTHYTYDSRNRLKTITFADASVITVTWDAGDRPTVISDSVNGSISRTYDGLDRPMQETTPQGQVNYTYDVAGRRSTMTVTGQTVVNYGFDAANKLTSITQGTNVVGITYDAANRRTGVTLPNGIVGTFGYDNADELQTISYDLGATHIADAAYTYDAAGRRLTSTGSLVRPAANAGRSATSYDISNRLSGSIAGTLTYDANGNLLTISGAAANMYTWNARNQLISTGKGTTLAYDALGRLSSRTEARVEMSYVYDGANQVLAGGNFMLRGQGLDALYADVVGGTTVNYLTDGLGSASMLTSVSGSVTTLYSYGAYGSTSATGASGAVTVDSPFKYAGGNYDQADALYYDRARFYSPGLQRFISEDPIGLNAGPNVYAYVGNDPLDKTDPSGKWCMFGGIGTTCTPDPPPPSKTEPTPSNQPTI